MIGTSHLRAALLCGTALVIPGIAAAQAPSARPQGGQVVAGAAAIRQDAARTQVTQSTDRAAIDWRSFDIGRDHAVQFQQPSSSSVTLNRVTGPDPSLIAGRITANGQVAIVNQSGVVFSGGAQVDAAGLVVSTANIANDAFMRGGRMTFNQPGRPDARIENNGSITVREAGLAALVAPQVANRGTINARMGRVVLAGAETSTVDLHGDGLLSLEVTSPVRQRPANGEALVSNTGSITATGGTVQLTASAVDGIVQDLVRAGGRISADTDAATGRTGRIVASGTGGAVRIEGEVTARGTAAGTRGGVVEAVAERVLVASGARVDASGHSGGGSVAIGTTPTGAARPRLSRRAGIAQSATVRADATARGDGGRVLLNSTDYTAHAGAISAQGGPEGGNGGFVEVSGQRGLSIAGTVNVNAGLGGLVGTFLIDPTNLTIVAGTGSGDALAADGVLAAGEGPADANVGTDFINSFPGNLRLEALDTITVVDAVDKAGVGDLALVAGNTVNVNAPLRVRAGDLLLQADSTATININNLVQVSDTNRITLDGRVTESGAGRLVGGSLNISRTQSSLSLLGANNIGTLENFVTEGAAEFNNVGSLRLANGFGGGPNASVRIDIGGDLVVAGPVTAGGGLGTFDGASAVLRAGGNVTVEGGSSVLADGVRIQAAHDPVLGGSNPLLTGGITLAGPVTVPFDIQCVGVSCSTMELGAGTGGIVQSGGFVRATRLTMQSGGDALLGFTPVTGDGNLVDVIGPSTIAGNLTFVGRDAGFTGNVATDGTVSVGGTADFTLLGSGLTQFSGSRIIAGRLTGSASNFALAGENLIGTVGDLTGSNGVLLSNAQSLRVTGAVATQSSSATINVVGDFDLASTGSIRGEAGVDINATGSIRTAAGSFIEGSGFSQTIRLNAAFDFAAEGTNPVAAGGLVLGGRVGNTGGANDIELQAGMGGIVQTGGRLVGNRLLVQSGGDALLNGANGSFGPNSVATLLPSSAVGDFVLDNGTSNLLIGDESSGSFTGRTFAVRTAGDATVQMEANLSATERASFRVGSLNIAPGSDSNPGSVTAPLVEVAPYSPAAMAITTAVTPEPFRLSLGTLSRISTGTLRLGATTFDGATTSTASLIRFPVSFAFPGTLDLRSLGNITQEAGANLSAGTLTGVAGGEVVLTNAGNALPELADFSAGTGFAMRTGGELTITGAVESPNVALQAAGNVVEIGSGRIGGGTLRLQSGGFASLGGANTLTGLANSTTADGLFLNNASTQLTVPIGNVVNAGGHLNLVQNGDLVVDGTVTGTATGLEASGRMQINGSSAIARSGDLEILANVFGLAGLLSASGEIRVQAGTLASLAGRASAGTLRVTAPTVSFGGLDAAGAAVILQLHETGSATGDVAAGGLTIAGGRGATLTGTIAGTPGGPAAALGRRATPDGTPLTEPLPAANEFLFNNCQIGVAVCVSLVPPTPPAPPSPPAPPLVGSPVGPVEAEPEVEPRAIALGEIVTLADNPAAVLSVLDPAVNAPAIDRLRPPLPNISVRIGRDRSEEDDLAPPNIRGEDY
jgi:filamentous hemagglutinin family protein